MAIETIPQMAEALEQLGYEVKTDDVSVMTKVGGEEKPFPAVITLNDVDEFVITCRMAKLGAVKELEKFLVTALDANTRILPYAIGLLTASDNAELDDEEEWPVVIVNSIPKCDLSLSEVESAMDSLLRAILMCANEFKELLN